jgi:hypothetical protein
MTSILDRLYASQSNRLLFFRDGWGNLPRLLELYRAGDHPGPPRPIAVRWEEIMENGTALLRRDAFAHL